jgi:hypothetical protein
MFSSYAFCIELFLKIILKCVIFVLKCEIITSYAPNLLFFPLKKLRY